MASSELPMAGNGVGRRQARPFTKGRQLDPAALAEIRALLGGGERRQDLLLEYLHLIQDRYGCLSAQHLTALAEEMKLAQTEVYEVASFYAHFDIIREGDMTPPALTVRVCDSLTCELAGGHELLRELRARLRDARVLPAPCIGRCDMAPAVHVGHANVDRATSDSVRRAVAERHEPEPPAAIKLDAYRQAGGYRTLGACQNGSLTIDAAIDAIEKSGLRGLGGAGFPSGRKWRVVRAQPAPRYLAVNADEGEPGTFKDRWLLEHDPHRVVEGALIAAWAMEATEIYFYLRDEYPAIRELLRHEIANLGAAGLTGGARIHLRRGAGAYICGEESAMLESIEGKRPLPRHRPPYPAEVGLFGRPTLIHNVETLFWLRDVLEKGPEHFAALGRRGHQGMRAFSVSGRVKEPGVKLAPNGVTARELIEEFSGGMAAGHRFKGYLPGGASGGILPASMADVPLDFGALESYGSFVGSAAVVVLSDRDSTKAAALNLMRFFADESCGKCTPCRVGTEKAVELMQQPAWDEALLNELAQAMRDASICGLGQAAPNTFASVFRFFREDLK